MSGWKSWLSPLVIVILNPFPRSSCSSPHASLSNLGLLVYKLPRQIIKKRLASQVKENGQKFNINQTGCYVTTHTTNHKLLTKLKTKDRFVDTLSSRGFKTRQRLQVLIFFYYFLDELLLVHLHTKQVLSFHVTK